MLVEKWWLYSLCITVVFYIDVHSNDMEVMNEGENLHEKYKFDPQQARQWSNIEESVCTIQ